MNYLAHCHLAYLTRTSFTGAILGDFVKGPISALTYSEEITKGVFIHRKVDSFTDQHEITEHWKTRLGKFRRYGGIVLDMFYDHVLAKSFSNYQLNLAEFSQSTYINLEQSLSVSAESFPERYVKTIKFMSKHDWLGSYQQLESITRALAGIDTRLSKPVGLEASADWYLQHQTEFDRDFVDFYQQLQAYVHQFTEN